MAERGKFIVIEGVDGSGKGVCLDYLKKQLESNPPAGGVVFTCEPGGTAIGKEIREVLLRHRCDHLTPLAELLLFVADRNQHIEEVVRPNLEAGKHVISDRFASSSFAYQVRANQREDLRHAFEVLHEWAIGLTRPDLYILLDLDPPIAKNRMIKREGNTRFDVKELDYHLRVRDGLLEYIKDFPHVVIDASQPPEKVREEILQAINGVLRGP